MIEKILIRGAKVHNLKNIDVLQECQARVSPLLQWVYYMQRVLGAIWKRCLLTLAAE